ncbi:hypothetical protein EE612_029315 [Oryza sativa]|nr:hypothetical protein EE612_029315 [Oryza sativa]
MRHTLQNRFTEAEVETVAAEKKKVERETLAEKMLNEQELILDATKERSKMLEQQVRENAKLRELLMDRGQVVDALQGEMLGIFDKISQLQLRVDKQLPEPLLSSMSSSVNSADNIAQLQCRVDDPQHSVDDSLQLASPRLSSSFKSTDSTAQAHCRVDEPQISVDESLLPVDECEQLQLISPRLSSSVMSAQSQYRVDEPLLPVDEVLQLASSSLSSSLKSGDNIAQLLGVLDVHLPVDELLQLPSLILSSSVKSSDSIAQFQQKADADEMLQSSSLASSEKPATFKNWSSASDTITQFQQRANADESLPLPSSSLASSGKPATFMSTWSSAAESNSVFSGDEEIDDASFHDSIDLDDSWDLVDDEAIYMCAN